MLSFSKTISRLCFVAGHVLSRVIDGRFAGPHSHQIVITHAEWRVVPTGEAMQRWTDPAMDETL
jgi:hypothetical protein